MVFEQRVFTNNDNNSDNNGNYYMSDTDNINKTELDDIKENVENNSPIIEIGEGNNLDNYVLFKLKKKPKNAFFST